MARTRRIRVALQGAALAALCAGCGGGGGGGDATGSPDAPSQPASTTAPANNRPIIVARDVLPVAVSSLTSSFTRALYPEMPDLTLTLRATGDVSVLNGKAIYVVVETGDADLFQANPAVSISDQPPGATVTLKGAVNTWTLGRHTGELRVYVCTTPDCTVQFGNSPLRVPYDITVRKGMSVSDEFVAFTQEQGSPRQTVDVQVTPPEGATDWQLAAHAEGDMAQKVGSVLRISPRADQPPGTYDTRFWVESSVTVPWDGSSYSQTFAKSVMVRYTITR